MLTTSCVSPCFADDKLPKTQVLRTLVTVWSLLAFLSILIMALGAIWLIVRYRRTLALKRRKRTIYRDLKIGNEFEEFENPLNEPDVAEDDDTTIP